MFAFSSRVLALIASGCLLSFPVLSAEIRLNDWAFNINGEITEYYAGHKMPGDGYVDPLTGLGSLSFIVIGAGDHSFTSFFDLEFAAGHNTFFNEYGAAHGTAAAGQSWQIDEPGLLFGTIYDNLLTGELNNQNTIPAGAYDDVSVALGWSFTLAEGESALISLMIAEFAPDSAFYLSHTDPEMGAAFDQYQSVYFWSSLEITGGAVNVTEASTAALLMFGLGGLWLRRRSARS